LAGIAAGIGNIAAAIASLIADGASFINWLDQLKSRADRFLESGVKIPFPDAGAAIAKQKAMNAAAGSITRNPFDLQRAAIASSAASGTYNAALPLSALGAAPSGGGASAGGGAAAAKEAEIAVERSMAQREQWNQALEKSQQEFNDRVAEGAQLTSGFAQSLVGGMMEGQRAVDALSESLKSLSQQLMNKALEQGINMLFAAVSSGLMPVPGVPPGGYTGLLPQSFGGFRAAGGPVSSGKGYIVGEDGPELFVPRMSGQIQSNGASRVEVQVFPGEYFDARVQRVSGPMVEAGIRRNNQGISSARRHGVRGI
jgi:hypothetical protein